MKYNYELGCRNLKKITENLVDLNELSLFLSKQVSFESLKTLQLMLVNERQDRLEKELDVNYQRVSIKTDGHNIEHLRCETLAGNLSVNPQRLGFDLYQLLVRNYKVDLSVEPYDSSYSINDFFIRSFYGIDNPTDAFYMRTDLIQERINLIHYLLQNKRLKENELSYLNETIENCSSLLYTSNQLNQLEELANRANKILTHKQPYCPKYNLKKNGYPINMDEIKRYEKNFRLSDETDNYMLNELTPVISRIREKGSYE